MSGKEGRCAGEGATVERGRIVHVTDAGYLVVSLDRAGLVSGVITGTDDTAYQMGDMVYFFLFRDGTGKIICRI